MEVVLASESPYRREQLKNFGVAFKAMKPKVDEERLKRTGPSDLTELTRDLAQHKAESLKGDYPNALILGSDQIAELKGERLDKPGTEDRAFAQLKKLQGQTHRLITSLAVCWKGETRIYTDITRITLRNLKDEEIRAYLKIDEPLNCAGSYKIEKAGLALVEKLETSDPSAIQGLPLLSFRQALNDFSIPLAQLWRSL